MDRIASNRRLIGQDGTVWAMRLTRTRDPMVRAAPEGLIDPMLKTVGFWNEDEPLAAAHYYAVHPTSVDGTGVVNPEFVGQARNRRTVESGVPHLYFTGCAGDVAAGKYNDGIADNRELFAGRIHEAMVAAEQAAERHPLAELRWVVEPVLLPPRPDLDEDALLARIRTPAAAAGKDLSRAALMLTYLRRRERPIPVTCLHLGAGTATPEPAGRDLHRLPAPRPGRRGQDAFVAVAGYGDLGPGYITLERSFAEGGYEPTDAFVSGTSEAILRGAIDRVLRG